MKLGYSKYDDLPLTLILRVRSALINTSGVKEFGFLNLSTEDINMIMKEFPIYFRDLKPAGKGFNILQDITNRIKIDIINEALQVSDQRPKYAAAVLGISLEALKCESERLRIKLDDSKPPDR